MSIQDQVGDGTRWASVQMHHVEFSCLDECVRTFLSGL